MNDEVKDRPTCRWQTPQRSAEKKVTKHFFHLVEEKGLPHISLSTLDRYVRSMVWDCAYELGEDIRGADRLLEEDQIAFLKSEDGRKMATLRNIHKGMTEQLFYFYYKRCATYHPREMLTPIGV